jgi:hypothetical protein
MAAQLNSVQAEEAMAKILAVLDDDATQAKLLAIVREVNALPPQQQQMQKMGRLFPAVQEATAPVLAEYGFAKEQLMGFGMQMQAHAAASPAVKAGVARLMALMSGSGGLGEPPKGEGPPRGGGGAAAAPRVPTELASEAFDARCDLTIRPQNLCDMQMDKCDQLIGSEDRAAIASCVKHTRTRFGGHIDVQVSLTALRVHEAKLAKRAADPGAADADAAPRHTAVLGVGGGAKVAAELLSLGHHVHVFDATAGTARIKQAVSGALFEAQTAGLVTDADAAAAFRRLSAVTSIGEAVRDCTLIIESVADTIRAKEEVYPELVKHCRPDGACLSIYLSISVWSGLVLSCLFLSVLFLSGLSGDCALWNPAELTTTG